MTVAELKLVLEKYPASSLVLVEGYEGGFADILTIKETKVELDHYSEDWNGPHEETENASVPALIILRVSNESDQGVV